MKHKLELGIIGLDNIYITDAVKDRVMLIFEDKLLLKEEMALILYPVAKALVTSPYRMRGCDLKFLKMNFLRTDLKDDAPFVTTRGLAELLGKSTVSVAATLISSNANQPLQKIVDLLLRHIVMVRMGIIPLKVILGKLDTGSVDFLVDVDEKNNYKCTFEFRALSS